jgi:hypothetical protein
MRALVFAIVASGLVLLQAPAFAGQVFFTNLIEPGDQYGPDPLGVGHTPSYLPGETGQLFGATGFTSNADFRLTSFNIAIGYVDTFATAPGPDQALVSLESDSGGLPGNTIESWTLTNLPIDCFPCPLTTVTPVSEPILKGGTPYWIVVTGGLETFDVWTFTSFAKPFQPLAAHTITNGVDSGWQLVSPPNTRQGALEVFGDPVPEPRTGELMMIVSPPFLIWCGFRSKKPRYKPRGGSPA